MTTGEKLAVNLLKPVNPSIIVILGIYTIVWGLWILVPWWDVFTQAPLYSAMAGIASETFWGFTAIAAGLITCYGAVKPSYPNLRIGSFTGFLHWFIIAVFYFVGDWTSTGGITSLTFAIYSGLVWLNIKINKPLYTNGRD